MTTRIRYNTSIEGVFTTRNPIVYNGTSYTVSLDTKSNTWSIFANDKVVSSGSETTLPGLKKAARFAFLALGVNLGSETRQKKAKLDVAAKIV